MTNCDSACATAARTVSSRTTALQFLCRDTFASWVCSANIQFTLGQIHNLIAGSSPGFPYRYTPLVNHGIPLLSRCDGHDIGNDDSTSLLWQRRSEPLLTALCQLHMSLLYLSARKISFYMQIKTDQGEHNSDGLGGVISVLSRVRIDNILMDERRICMRQGVVRQLVIKVLICRHMSSHDALAKSPAFTQGCPKGRGSETGAEHWSTCCNRCHLF